MDWSWHRIGIEVCRARAMNSQAHWRSNRQKTGFRRSWELEVEVEIFRRWRTRTVCQFGRGCQFPSVSHGTVDVLGEEAGVSVFLDEQPVAMGKVVTPPDKKK